MSESLEDVLQIANKPSKQKLGVSKTLPESSEARGLFDIDDSEDTSKDISSMGTDDIMKYIEQNEADDADLDLF